MYKPGYRKMAVGVLAVIALVAVGLATPQGRAVAQDILQFFTRAEGREMPLQPWQIVQPGSVESEPTAEPPAPFINIIEAEKQAGFDAAELPAVPSGLEFLGARLYGKAISIEYAAPGADGYLILKQSREGFIQSDWDHVPADAVIPVRIGDLDAEFAQGTFVVLPGDASASWNSSMPVLRLRWVRDGTWYELVRSGNGAPAASLDQAALVALAGSLQYPSP